jgi:hypothetical protein
MASVRVRQKVKTVQAINTTGPLFTVTRIAPTGVRGSHFKD